MKRPGDKKFNAVSHNRSRPEVLFFEFNMAVARADLVGSTSTFTLCFQ